MTQFKRTNLKIFTKSAPELTADNQYWRKIGVPVLVKEFGPIDYIDFSPIEPHYFAVTCSVRVQLYNPITKQVAKNLSRFRQTAYGGSFRGDGRLICAGGEENIVKLFDVESKALLRIFKGHTSAVHRSFFVTNKPQIASFSDDKSVVLWDIPSEKQITTFNEHTDYVRAGAVSPVSSDCLLSGGYDNSIHMYDTRTSKFVFKVDHGAPVESILYLPTGGVFLSAGGMEIRVWDAFAGGRLLAKLSHHHKTITCLCLGSQNRRFLSGSLDRHVKIYDISTYNVVHTLDYPNSVLSLGVSVGDKNVVAGMVDGLVAVSRRAEEQMGPKPERRKASYRFASEQIRSHAVDFVVPAKQQDNMSKYEHCLRTFQYAKALDIAFVGIIAAKSPEVTVGVCLELIRRKGLAQALAGRSDKSLLTIIKFLIKNIGQARFTRTLIDVTCTLIDVYDETIEDLSPEVIVYLRVLSKKMKDEEKLTGLLIGLQGAMQMLLAGASINEQESQLINKTNGLQLEPSINAQQSL